MTNNLQSRVERLERLFNRHFPDALRTEQRKSVETIQKIVADEFDLPSHNVLLSASTKQSLAWPRHIAMSMAYAYSGLGTPEIARLFNREDHSTISHACRRVRNEEATSKAQARVVECVRQRVVKALEL
jgi:chromosomal replication initiator protein